MKLYMRTLSVPALLILGACMTMPTGPSVMVMPGTGKNFDQFRADDAVCRQYALEQVGGTDPNQVAVDSGVKSAAVGTIVGAAAGAAMGGNSQGAAAGAGVGLLVGALAGTGAGQSSAYGTQHRYDNAFIQCMYAKGHRVPVSGQLMSAPAQRSNPPPPPPPGYAPPPPPGYGPPPPPAQ
jgi:hypothetical protein